MDMEVKAMLGQLCLQGKNHFYYLDFRQEGLQSPPDSMEETQRRSWDWNPYCLLVHPVR